MQAGLCIVPHKKVISTQPGEDTKVRRKTVGRPNALRVGHPTVFRHTFLDLLGCYAPPGSSVFPVALRKLSRAPVPKIYVDKRPQA